MKHVLVLNQLAVGIALFAGSTLAFAQVEPEIDMAGIASQNAQQTAVGAVGISMAHARAGAAARSLFGQAADTMNPDELEASIADRVPGFAGWVHREDGSTVMRMAGNGSKGKASALRESAAVASLTRSLRVMPEVQAALWDSRQLLTFKRAAFGLARVKGVIATAIDREANRVEVTYNNEMDAVSIEALSDQLVAAGVPRAAVVLRPGELPKRLATIGTSVRSQPLPLAAGAQFNFGTTEGNFVCSVGVPARRGGVTGFVTASHCSQRTYSVAARTRMTAPNGTFIGSETVDPAGFDCPLRDNLGCREADALFASGGPANAVDFGRVLYTSVNGNSLTVQGTIPVVGSQAYPTRGQLIYKTGRTTGTRSATVARVCVDTLVGNEAQTEFYGALCSVEVDSSTFIAGGDSGSSVWTYNGTGAVITGIVSYGSSRSGGFSPWGGVTKELGALTIR